MVVTVNYSWELPTVGGDINAWGTKLNANFTDIDARLFAEINTPRPVARGGTGGATIGAAQIALQIQPVNANLTAEAGLVGATDRLAYFTGVGTKALTTLTAAGRALIDDADTTAQRATLGLVIGTHVQAQNATLQGLTSGAFTSGSVPFNNGSGILVPLTVGGNGTQLTVVAGYPTWTTPTVYAPAILTQGPITASGTSVVFSSIPAGVDVLTIDLYGLSLSGTNHVGVQLGAGGVAETTGYLASSASLSGSSTNAVGETTAFVLYGGQANRGLSGVVRFERIAGLNNQWVSSHSLYSSFSDPSCLLGGGRKTLAGALDSIRLIALGADTFDAGIISIRYS